MGDLGFGKGSQFEGGDGDGEWSSVSGVVGIFSADGGYSTSGGESVGSSESTENRLLISWLSSNTPYSSLLSRSSSFGSMTGGGRPIVNGVNDELRIYTS